ncbi:hypothetical protein ASG82_12615 [Mycobacterium sp. Soil538]|nr:hypothetical protein ASG82_12615 [Mycobacterium sp. Soil538]
MSTAVLVMMAAVVVVQAPTQSPALKLSADATALIMGGTSVPKPDQAYIDIVNTPGPRLTDPRRRER